MLRRIGSQLHKWSGPLALFLVLASGTAYAANTVLSADIVDGEVKTPDLALGAVNFPRIANDAITGLKVKDGTLSGRDIADNTLTGADINEGTVDIGNAARAYARVDPDSCTGTPGTCSFEESKGISGVTREDVGNYCVTAPGIDRLGTPAAVTVDSAHTQAAGQTSATTHEGPITGFGPCADGGFGVITERQQIKAVDAGGGTNNAFVSEQARSTNDVAFTIVIP